MALQNVQIQVQTPELMRLMERVKDIGGKKALNAVRRATSRGGTVLLQTFRPLIPVRTGLLRKSFGKKDSKPKTAYAYSIVGPRKGFRQVVAKKTARSRIMRAKKSGKIAPDSAGRIQNPTKYAHLVDRGHKIRGGAGFVKGRRFYFAAEIAARQRIENVMKMELQRTLIAEANQPTSDT